MIDTHNFTQHDTCILCDGTLEFWRKKVVEDVEYNIDQCEMCDFAFVNPRPDIEFLKTFYSNFGHGGSQSDYSYDLNTILEKEREDPNSSIDAKRIIARLKVLKPELKSPKLLDVGSGFGFFSREALAQGYDVSAVDLADQERNVYAEMNGFHPDLNAYEDYDQSERSFDIVLMSHVLEHAQDPKQWVSKTRDLLKTGGVFAIALPNFDSLLRQILQEKEPYICPPEHLNFFSSDSLTKLLEDHGFKVLKRDWVSRLPKSTFKKRLKGPLKGLAPIVHASTSVGLRAVDIVRKGTVISLYAKKI